MIYLDYNATTPLKSGARKAMEPYWSGRFGNASSIHGHGQEAMQAVLAAREQVADLAGAKRDNVYFTGSGTEAVVTAVVGGARADAAGRKHVLISAVEHAAAQEAGRWLRDLDYTVDTIPCEPDGRVTPQALMECIRPDTVLASVMHANNETGVIQPVKALSAVCKEHGVLLHVDAAQSAGKTVLDLQLLGCDLLSLSAHKIGGPKGVGALVRKSTVQLKPLIPGHQEQGGFRGGGPGIPAPRQPGAVARNLRGQAQGARGRRAHHRGTIPAADQHHPSNFSPASGQGPDPHSGHGGIQRVFRGGVHVRVHPAQPRAPVHGV